VELWGTPSSAARLSGVWPDPRLCAPTSRWVCLCRERVLGNVCSRD